MRDEHQSPRGVDERAVAVEQLAQDLRAVTAVRGTWAGDDVGALADVTPEPGFGFSSTPRRPAVTTVTTFVEVPD